MFIEKFLIAFFAMDLGSRWIDHLYSIPTAPLSFPNEIESRQKLRKSIIFLSILLSIEFLNELDSIVAIFFLTLITLTDLEQHVILDRMSLPFAIIALARIFYLQLNPTEHFLTSLGGGVAFLILAILTRGAIGGGDIKLIAILGLWFNPETFLAIVTWGMVLGGISATILLATGLKSRKDFFAYGPYFTIVAMYFICN